MSKFLKDLVTADTKIVHLRPNDKIDDAEKYRILYLNSSLDSEYIKNMYYKNRLWYYFKKDENNYCYPFYIFDELMGTYLANKRNLATVSYVVAKVGKQYGLASINFKKNNFAYYKLSDLISQQLGERKFNTLINFTVDADNKKIFLDHLFNLFSLDIHMLQKDRGDVNLQFQVDKKTGYFDVAPLYDYSNCSTVVGESGIFIPNKIIKLDYITIRKLLIEYKKFKEALESCLETSMEKIWEQICDDYHFNKESFAYEDVKDHYKIKDESQKQYINRLLKGIK